MRKVTYPIKADTLRAFRVVLDNAAPGQRIVYHTGNLSFDRDEWNRNLASKQKHELNQLANAAYDAAMVGKVFLFQRRLGPGVCEYQAMRRSGRVRQNGPMGMH
jgi:hypothetical protein